MSQNQLHAIELAEVIARGEIEAAQISDADWNLLLLAAGLNNTCAGVLAVAEGVLSSFKQKIGYFTPERGERHRTFLDAGHSASTTAA